MSDLYTCICEDDVGGFERHLSETERNICSLLDVAIDNKSYNIIKYICGGRGDSYYTPRIVRSVSLLYIRNKDVPNEVLFNLFRLDYTDVSLTLVLKSFLFTVSGMKIYKSPKSKRRIIDILKVLIIISKNIDDFNYVMRLMKTFRKHWDIEG
jgi:hypothetical protein